MTTEQIEKAIADGIAYIRARYGDVVIDQDGDGFEDDYDCDVPVPSK